MKKGKQKVATVHVALTQYGRASYKLQQAARKAELCQHPLLEEAAMYRARTGEAPFCMALAKFTLEGMNVCGKHASFILLQAAYKAGAAR